MRSSAAFLALSLAAGTGALLQLAVPCPRCASPFVGASLAVLYASIAGGLPPRARRALLSQEAFAAILAALAAVCALGTLVVQGEGEPFYLRTYGPALSAAILRLGLDDAFHSLWFAGIAGVFCGSIVLSASRRWPPSGSTAGFHLAHAGLLVALGGAAASSALAVRGRVELRAGETAREVRPAAAHRSHAAAGPVPLGFALRLDRFDVERWGSELRIGYYERREDGWRLRASFEPEPGVAHRLPSGASFAVRATSAAAHGDARDAGPLPRGEGRGDGATPGPQATAVIRVADDGGGAVSDVPLLAGANAHLLSAGTAALVLEPRPPEPRSFRSTVTTSGPGGERTAVVAVNSPFSHRGWTFYQASYDPEDPAFTVLEAVRDPGAVWVLAGAILVATGVAHALFTAAWLRRPRG